MLVKGMSRMTNLSRRIFLCGAAPLGVMSALETKQPQVHRFRTTEFSIEITVDYHDQYASKGFWFREKLADRGFCLSGEGTANRACLTSFRGSLAIAQYRVRSLSSGILLPALRESVQTVDHDARLPLRPPFERTIELKKGVCSDLQAFGYEPAPDEGPQLDAHGPWYLFRQNLFLEPQRKPFLAIFWKHALHSIRVLDLIPGEQTWPVTK
jgi:hypothetical protein